MFTDVEREEYTFDDFISDFNTWSTDTHRYDMSNDVVVLEEEFSRLNLKFTDKGDITTTEKLINMPSMDLKEVMCFLKVMQ